MTRVLLVDDQPLVRAGLRLILLADERMEVVGECSDGDQVLSAIEATSPDVIVMDIRMKRMDGAEATRRVRSLKNAPPVLVLTTFDDDEVLSSALRAGAAGFQLKDVPGEDLISAVRSVADGGAWLDPAVTARVLAAYRTTVSATANPSALIEHLTAREQEVLRLMGRGASNREIATELFVSEVTVKTHVGHIFTKLDVRDRAAAIVFAFDHGFAFPGETR